ncbi:hypothetical protein [Methylibium sp.]|uniref:hypothetical protein n=1 Tax=Methylibium sp. TaxID=2067992 RepID=UPI003BAC7C77
MTPTPVLPSLPDLTPEIECAALSAWNLSEYGTSAEDTVHPMFLAAFKAGFQDARRAIESLSRAPAEPIAEGLLQSACARMLANANWSVACALSPASKRKDFPSNGWASVKLRDLASVRDTLSAASGDSTESAGPAPAEMVERLKSAIEGECDGLAVDDQHAKAILDYVLGESHEG